MKAIVKASEETVEVVQYGKHHFLEYIGEKTGRLFLAEELDLLDNDPDYWTKLEHQYAGMAMQGMIRRAYEAYCDDCANYENMIFEDAQALLKDHAEALADVCVEYAHALVKKMKEERK
jgi:hypothetical protein